MLGEDTLISTGAPVVARAGETAIDNKAAVPREGPENGVFFCANTEKGA
jgi:hypothetical protein